MHRQFFIDCLVASGVEVPTRGATLMVVRRKESPELDWELVVQTTQVQQIEQAPYELEMAGPEGSLNGSAILVRSDGISHVFRGAGQLGGFSERDFGESKD